jgi:predicted amidohydrolase
MARTVRIASCSIMPKKWDKAGNLAKMLAFMKNSLAGNPDLITTPEGCLEGYCVGEVSGQERRDEFMEIAEPEDGEAISRFRDFCSTHSVNALVCFSERDGNEAFNTALWIDRSGATAGKYRKTHLCEGYQDECYHNRPGMNLDAFNTDIGRVGVMICFDRRVPEVARSLMLDGAEILVNPSYGFYQGCNDAILITRAHENQLPVLFTHPNKTLCVDQEGNVVLFREQEDAISHVEIEIPEKMNVMRHLRRPEIYSRIQES